MIGKCRLCLTDNSNLLESHFMPAALYPKNKRITSFTQSTTTADPTEVKAYLLCSECEGKFNRNGESEVLRWIAPRALRKGSFPLLARLKNAQILLHGADLTIYAGRSVGIDTDKFAYFALSVLWRAAVHQRTLPDGTLTTPRDLGVYEEPIRKFLMGEKPFPLEAVVVVTVCTDPLSQEHWMHPMFGMEEGCMTFPFLALGVIFRVWLGISIPERIRRICCCSSPENVICSTYCDDKTQELLNDVGSNVKQS
jgi:hypothetical protein